MLIALALSPLAGALGVLGGGGEAVWGGFC